MVCKNGKTPSFAKNFDLLSWTLSLVKKMKKNTNGLKKVITSHEKKLTCSQ
jgi:hypothetical protein